MPAIEVEKHDRTQGKKAAGTSPAGKNVGEESATPSEFHRSQEEWVTAFTGQAEAAKKRGAKPAVEAARLAGGIAAVAAMVNDPKNREMVPLLAARGLDGDFFGSGGELRKKHAAAVATPLPAAGTEVLTPEERQWVNEGLEFVRTMRDSTRSAALVLDIPDEIPGGTRLEIHPTVPSVKAAVKAFLDGVPGREAVLAEAAIGEDDLNKLRDLHEKLESAGQNKTGRQGVRKQKTTDVTVTELAMSLWLKTFESRAALALLKHVKLRDQALAVVPKPEHRSDEGKAQTKQRRARKKQKTETKKQVQAQKRQAKRKKKTPPSGGNGSGS